MAVKSSKKSSIGRPLHVVPSGKAQNNPASVLQPRKPKAPAPKRKPQGYVSQESQYKAPAKSGGQGPRKSPGQTKPAHTPTKYTDVRGRSRVPAPAATVSSIRRDKTIPDNAKERMIAALRAKSGRPGSGK